MASSNPVFVEASPPEILRSAQKDESYIAHLKKELSEILQQLLRNQTPGRVQAVSDVSSVLLYYSLTTLLDSQTLGEEYIGLLQVDPSLRRLPSKLTRLVAILLQVLGPRALSGATKRLAVWLRDPSHCPELRPDSREKLVLVTDMVGNSSFWIGRLNLVLFYILGKYYRLSQRAAGIHLIRTLDQLKTAGGSRKTFQIIGVTALIHLALMAAMNLHGRLNGPSLRSHQQQHQQQDDASPADSTPTAPASSSSSSSSKCSLCWDQRVNPACTPCGHLFCWDCVLHWLQTKHECPLCRENVQPSRVVPLLNYQ